MVITKSQITNHKNFVMIFVIGINYSRHFTKSTSNIYVTSNRWFAIYHTSDQHHLQHTLSRRRRINIEHHEHQHWLAVRQSEHWRDITKCRREITKITNITKIAITKSQITNHKNFVMTIFVILHLAGIIKNSRNPFFISRDRNFSGLLLMFAVLTYDLRDK